MSLGPAARLTDRPVRFPVEARLRLFLYMPSGFRDLWPQYALRAMQGRDPVIPLSQPAQNPKLLSSSPNVTPTHQ